MSYGFVSWCILKMFFAIVTKHITTAYLRQVLWYFAMKLFCLASPSLLHYDSTPAVTQSLWSTHRASMEWRAWPISWKRFSTMLGTRRDGHDQEGEGRFKCSTTTGFWRMEEQNELINMRVNVSLLPIIALCTIRKCVFTPFWVPWRTS